MTELKRIFTLFLVLGGLTAGLAACDNTIRGIGQDISDSADAVKDSVK